MKVTEWIGPALATLTLLILPLVIARMSHTVISRLVSDDRKAHEQRMERSLLPRKDEARQRQKSVENWQQIERLRAVRNACLLTALAVFEVNLFLILSVVLNESTLFSTSLLVVCLVVFAYAAYRLVIRKQDERPEWVTTPDYYRKLLKGDGDAS